MGYYTRYTLTCKPPLPALAQEEAILDLGPESDSSGSVWGFCDGEPLKWYAHEDDMLIISGKHPNTLFILDGRGEEAGDVWRKWFKGGELIKEWRCDSTPPEEP